MPVTLMTVVNTKKPKMPHAIEITDCVCASFDFCSAVLFAAVTTAATSEQSSRRMLLRIPAQRPARARYAPARP
eukprot:CAMPEP_0119056322 /NCGR_PEP_ID=MMETSP1178-20130426/1011_1 /TAXON_ID=33656 /ORGANISM="unid sp, Strain CCMP2000" /LENGTH=73 /DNA_ID=CAMNT_0007037043 /DNA_START=268 /DNA_END=485 /DNA_ORIENTATION=+